MYYRHYTILSSSYTLGCRIAYHFVDGSIDSCLEILREALPKQNYSVYTVEVEKDSLEALIEYDSFYRDIKFYESINDFIDCIKQDSDISVIDLAKYILSFLKKQDIKTTHLKLQKLVYFCYRDYLLKYDKKLFKEKIIHWQYGPVVRELFDYVKDKTRQDLKKIDSNFITTDINEEMLRFRILFSEDGLDKKKSVDETINKYKEYTASNLVKLTHLPNTPWDKTLNNSEITDDIIKEFSKNESLEYIDYKN